MDDGMGSRVSSAKVADIGEDEGEEETEEKPGEDELQLVSVTEDEANQVADDGEKEEGVEGDPDEEAEKEEEEKEDEEEKADEEEKEDDEEKEEEKEGEEPDTIELNGDVKSHASEEVVEIEEGGERKSLYERSSCARAIMGCGTCFGKYILCLFNFIVLIAGIGVLFLGVWLYTDKGSLLTFAKSLDEASIAELKDFTDGHMTDYIAYILMVVGGTMFILSIIGYCGALRESKCLLGFYGFLLVVILILEVTAAGLAFVYKDKAEGQVRQFLMNTIQDNYDPAGNNTETVTLNIIMNKLHCCGVNDYTDFNSSVPFRNSGLKIPVACCKDMHSECTQNPNEQNSYYMTGCYQTIMYQIKQNLNIVIYVLIGLVCVELLSTFLAFCLCKTLERFDK